MNIALDGYKDKKRTRLYTGTDLYEANMIYDRERHNYDHMQISQNLGPMQLGGFDDLVRKMKEMMG